MSANGSSSGNGAPPQAVAAPSKISQLTAFDVKHASKARKLEFLREVRTRPVHNPQLVLLCANDILAAGGVGEEIYAIREQCAIAALECGQHAHAEDCIVSLANKFGKASVRVRKLAGMLLEAKGEIRQAQKVYTEILRDVPSDLFCVKRTVALYKSIGAYDDAIDVLTQRNMYVDQDGNTLKVLEVHNTDESIYRELLNLYYYTWNLPKAIFYAEEVVMLSPSDYLHHTRHGELCYAARQLERSASSYAQSLRLNDGANNSRAAYGLWLVSMELVKNRHGKGKDTSHHTAAQTAALDEAKALHQYSSAKLRSLYAGSSLAPVLDLMITRGQ